MRVFLIFAFAFLMCSAVYSQRVVQLGHYDSLLFMGCGNEMKVDIPGVTDQSKLNYVATGAGIVLTKNKSVMVIPGSREVTLYISENGNRIAEFPFHVRLIPIPEIFVAVDEDTLTDGQRLALNNKSIKPGFLIDRDFTRLVPEDARFKTDSWKIQHIRNANILEESNVKGPEIFLTDYFTDIRSSDEIKITPANLYRLNFRNLIEEISNPRSLSISIL